MCQKQASIVLNVLLVISHASPSYMLCPVQVSNITNYALDLLTQAGVELVPFDSQALNDVSADAWGTGTESYAFEDTDTLARYVCLRPPCVTVM